MTTEAQAPVPTEAARRPQRRASDALPHPGGVPAPHRGTPREPGTGWIWGLAAGLFVLYAVVSIRQHQRMLSTGFDLGIFEQAVNSYAHGHLPTAEIKGPDYKLFGDHFSPVLALLVPFYRLFPSPVTLLVAQAALLAVAVVPIGRYAQRALGRPAALVAGLGYGLSWGIAQTIGFDFHEVVFAVPLMAFAAVALAEGRLHAAVYWALPMVLVKEDLGLTVAVVGGLVAWSGRRMLGAVTAAFGIVASAIEIGVIIPAANPEGRFSYLDKMHGESDGGSKVAHLIHRGTVGMISDEPKVVLLVLLVVPTAMVAVRSPLLLLAVPTLGWRLMSDNPLYWGTGYHYSAVLMPVVFVAFVDAMRRLQKRQGPSRVKESLVVSGVVTALLVPAYPLWWAVQPSTWKHDQRIDDAHAVLARIPDHTQVSASNRLVPQLTSRTDVSVFGWAPSRDNPEWIVVDNADPVNWPFGSMDAQKNLLKQAQDLGYAVVGEQGDFELLHRDPADTRQFPAPPKPPEAAKGPTQAP